jgi:predicted kinase
MPTPSAALLIVVSGAPASGKSTLAENLARALHWPVLDGDDIAPTLVPAAMGAVAGDPYALEHEFYTTVVSPAKAKAMAAQTHRLLELGRSHVLAVADASRLLRLLGDDAGQIIHLHACISHEQRRKRLQERQQNAFDNVMIAMPPLARWEETPATATGLDGMLSEAELTSAAFAYACTQGAQPDAEAQRPIGLVITGAPATGKTTLAMELGHRHRIAVFDSSDLSRTFVATVLEAVGHEPSDIDSELYTHTLSPAKAAAVGAAGLRALSAGANVIIPYCGAERIATALQHGSDQLAGVHLELPDEPRMARITTRQTHTDVHLPTRSTPERWRTSLPGALHLDASLPVSALADLVEAWVPLAG